MCKLARGTHAGKIPIELGQQDGVLTEGANVRYEVVIPQDGVTVRVCAREGSIIFFASYTATIPNEALHDFRREVISTGALECDDVFILPDPSSSTVCISVVGDRDVNDFVLDIAQGVPGE